MNHDVQQWLQSPLGGRLYALECKTIGEALSQVFGWQLLQIGQWGDSVTLLGEARTQRKAVLSRDMKQLLPGLMTVCTRSDALAIASDSVDAVLLPHTLEYEPDPHELLREVERVLLADGHLIVCGFRPISTWGIRHLLTHSGFPPGTERLISEHRLRDWLKLLGFEVMDVRRYLYTWPVGTVASKMEHFLEVVGEHMWPLLAGAYLLRARKRVYTGTPLRLRWRTRSRVFGGLAEPTTRNGA